VWRDSILFSTGLWEDSAESIQKPRFNCSIKGAAEHGRAARLAKMVTIVYGMAQIVAWGAGSAGEK